MSMNSWKWLAALGVGALGGLIEVASDPMVPGAWDVIRHLLLGMAPTVVALNITLTKKN